MKKWGPKIKVEMNTIAEMPSNIELSQGTDPMSQVDLQGVLAGIEAGPELFDPMGPDRMINRQYKKIKFANLDFAFLDNEKEEK